MAADLDTGRGDTQPVPVNLGYYDPEFSRWIQHPNKQKPVSEIDGKVNTLAEICYNLGERIDNVHAIIKRRVDGLLELNDLQRNYAKEAHDRVFNLDNRVTNLIYGGLIIWVLTIGTLLCLIFGR